MKILNLILITIFIAINSYSQLRKIYLNPEAGFMPHLQASCVAHFDHGISAQIGLNFGLGGLVQPKVFGSVYGTVGVMVGLVQSKKKSTPHPI